MSDDEAFVQAMLERPEDESVRLVYADWLEERGDARAELLRLQHALSRAIKPPQRKKLERRLQCLLVAGVRPVGPFITNSIGMEFALIPAGNFRMGSPRGEKDRRREENQHLVEITQPFFMGNHTVTTQQFRAFVNGAKYQTAAENKHGEGGWGFNEKDRRFEGPGLEYTWQNTGWAQSDAHPVVNVTWNDAVAFCEWLSKKEDKKYRLLTEAEWEYACRAQTTTRFYCSDDEDSLKEIANIADASFERMYPSANWAKDWDNGYPFTAPVGKFQPNAFGLYDMHGNVWEWSADWYDEDYYSNSTEEDPQGPGASDAATSRPNRSRVIRGGSFYYLPRVCRSAYRGNGCPSSCLHNLGFRVLLVW